jgi:tripartite-type tricarboxylate transporter receptor subunit TctC
MRAPFPLMRFAVSALLLAGVSLLPLPAAAQTGGATLPKNIQLVVPFPPGGGTDLFARQVSSRLATRTGSNVIVDNKPGAGGMIGTEFVARASADGSVLMITASDIAVSFATKKTLPFDPAKGITTVAILGSGPMLLVVNSDSPYKTTAQLLAAAREKSGALHYGSAGIGSLHHLSGELFNAMAGTQMTHVPYKGSAASTLDLAAGRIEMLIGSLPTTQSQIKAGKLRALGVTTAAPSKFAPELPTIGATVPGFQVEVWWGLFAPGGLPQPLVERLNSEVRAIVASADMREVFEREGVLPALMTPAESAAFMRTDTEKWREVARRQNIVVE